MGFFRSLLIKLALLASVSGLVLWIGWPVPRTPDGSPSTNPYESERPGPATLVHDGLVESPSQAGTESVPRRPEVRLDLNRAQEGELKALPGIGPGLARRIVEHRRQQGRFRSVEDLGRVKGIGTKRLARLRPLVMVEEPPSDGSGPGPENGRTGTPGG